MKQSTFVGKRIQVTGGDFRLAAGSPAIDLAAATGRPDLDLNRLPRPYDGDFDGEAAPDAGAYEYHPAFTDSDLDGFLDQLELDITGSPTAIPAPQLSIGSSMVGGQSYPLLSYEIDARVVGLLELGIERSNDLGTSDRWIEVDLIPVSETTEGDIHRASKRSGDAFGTAPSQYFRLRFELK